MKENLLEPHHHHHRNIRSHSTIVFSLFLFVAVTLDILLPYKFMTEPLNKYIGVIVIIIGTIIIYWAEDFDSKFFHMKKSGKTPTVETLCSGPYCYSRNPKYIGLGVLVVGLGFALNSILVIIAAILSVVVVNYFFLDKEEDILCTKHGDVYKEYQKKVNRWL